MKRRGGKREGAGPDEIACVDQYNERKSIKNTGEQISIIYIFGKSHFLNLAKASSGGNLRKRFELRVIAAWFGAQTKTTSGTQSIISSTRKTSIRTLFSTGGASVLVMTWVWFLNLDSGEVVETKL